jgi:chromosomal replication initiation ATPase DnaA
LRLPLRRPRTDRREDFIVSPGAAAAVAALDAWRGWTGGRLALIGPEGSGKTHLARAWAREADAVAFDPDLADLAALAGRAVLLEDADRRPADETLFHLINLADAGGRLLITARTPPRAWPAVVPDLRSRLNALMVAELPAPDDVVLEGVIRNFFRERHIRPEDDVPAFLARRIERSVPAAYAAVARIDELAAAGKREVNRVLAREVLEEHDQTLDLFE